MNNDHNQQETIDTINKISMKFKCQFRITLKKEVNYIVMHMTKCNKYVNNNENDNSHKIILKTSNINVLVMLNKYKLV